MANQESSRIEQEKIVNELEARKSKLVIDGDELTTAIMNISKEIDGVSTMRLGLEQKINSIKDENEKLKVVAKKSNSDKFKN